MGYNMKHAGVKRLMREAIEMKEPTDLYYAQPIDDENLFEWHFTVRGPPDTEFEDGIYHGRLSFPPDYPMKPPSIFLLTKNGRFEVNKKICLSISGYHPETWQPSWSVRTALLAIIGFMPSKGEGALGSLDYSPEERRNLAKYSIYFKCSKCGVHSGNILKTMQQSSDRCQSDLKEAKTLVENQYKPQTNQETSPQPSSSKPAGSSAESEKQLPSSGCLSDKSKSSQNLEQEMASNDKPPIANWMSSIPSNSACSSTSLVENVKINEEKAKVPQKAINVVKESSGSGASPDVSTVSRQAPTKSSSSSNMTHDTSGVASSSVSTTTTQQSYSQRRQQNDSIPLIVSAFVVFVAIIVLVLRRASRWDLWSEELERQLPQP